MLNQVQHDMEMKGFLIFDYGLWYSYIVFNFKENVLLCFVIDYSKSLNYDFSKRGSLWRNILKTMPDQGSTPLFQRSSASKTNLKTMKSPSPSRSLPLSARGQDFLISGQLPFDIFPTGGAL